MTVQRNIQLLRHGSHVALFKTLNFMSCFVLHLISLRWLNNYKGSL